MKKIKLTKNKEAIVDNEDYEWLIKYRWQASKINNYFYAGTSIKQVDGTFKRFSMHRLIMNNPNKLLVDHINHNTLDNRKQNLRTCNYSNNGMNRVSGSNKTSRYKGVIKNKDYHRNKNYNGWTANIKVNGKSIHLGSFETEIEAAKAYDKKAKELFGEFALLNFEV